MVVDLEAVVASLLIASVSTGLVLRIYRKPAGTESEQAVGDAAPDPAIAAVAAE